MCVCASIKMAEMATENNSSYFPAELIRRCADDRQTLSGPLKL